MARGRGRRELNGLGDSSAEKGTGDSLLNGKMKKKPQGKLSGKDKKRLDLKDERDTKRTWKKGTGERLAGGVSSSAGKGRKSSEKTNGRVKDQRKMKSGVKRKRG